MYLKASNVNPDLHHSPLQTGEGKAWSQSIANYQSRRTMTSAVTLYTKPDCQQCRMTKTQLDKNGIPHDIVDVTQDPEAHKFVTDLGYMQAPVVHAGPDNHWSGFRPDRIKALVQ